MKKLAKLFKGISDPTRLDMVALLLEHKELCVCDLMASLQLPQSTTSRHLAYLKRTGWLASRQEGIWSYYSLSSVLRLNNAELLATVSELIRRSKDMSAANRRLEELQQSKRPC